MEPGRRNIRLYRGDDYAHELDFVKADGTTPVDLTGSTWRAQIRNRPDAAAPILASFTVDASEQGSGKVVLHLAAATTAELPSDGMWDLEQTAPAGTVSTLLRGLVHVERDVTQ